MIGEDGVIVKRGEVVLRLVHKKGFPRVDEITIICNTSIYEDYLEMRASIVIDMFEISQS